MQRVAAAAAAAAAAQRNTPTPSTAVGSLVSELQVELTRAGDGDHWPCRVAMATRGGQWQTTERQRNYDGNKLRSFLVLGFDSAEWWRGTPPATYPLPPANGGQI